MDENNHAIARAIVKLTHPDGRFVAETRTDNEGLFNFDRIQRGGYVIRVSAAGFAGQALEVSVPAINSPDFKLRPGQLVTEITVTSTYLAGTNESLSEVPGAIDRLDVRSLEDSRVFDFSEALRKLPGINIRDEEGLGLRPNIGIRGTNPTRSSKILLLEDGIPLAYAPYGDNASYYHPPIERFESIEVLKGSGQIAYGPQTVGGVVNYITPMPTEKPSFAMKLAGGNRSFFNGSFTGSGTIGRTGVYANYARKQGDGARHFISSKLNDFSTKVVRSLNEKHILTGKFSYFGENSNVTYSGLTQAEYTADSRGNVFKNDFFYGDRFGFSVSHAAVITGQMALTTNFYASRFKRHWWRQSSNSGQRPNRLNVDPDCRGMADLNTTCGNEGRLREYQVFGVDPRFSYNYEAGNAFRGELQTGFRIHWEEQNRRQENGDLPTSRNGALAEINRRNNLAYAGFVQNRFIIGHLAITPGIRFERIRVSRENLLLMVPSFGETTVGAVIPGIGAAYSGLPKMTIFAGVHRGFSPPRAEDIISNTGGVVELDPEKSWNYEFGVRSNPIIGIRIDAAAFLMDYENQIVPASLAGGVGAGLTNGGATWHQGMEVNAQLDFGQIFRSNHNFYARAAYTWLPVAEFRGVRFSTITPTILVSKNRLPYAPEHLLTTSVGYAHPGGLDAFIENVYIGRQFSDDLNTVSPTSNGQRGVIDAQTYWNATVNYSLERIRTTFFVTGKNIFDRTLIVDRSRGILPSMGRQMIAGVKIKF